MRNIFRSLFCVLPFLSSCRDDTASNPEEHTDLVMIVSFSLSKEDEVLFKHTFKTSRSEKVENQKAFSIRHQVVPDKAEVYDEVCQVILKVKADDYTIAAHIPIHESETEEFINFDLDSYQLRFTCKLPQSITSQQNKAANKSQ